MAEHGGQALKRTPLHDLHRECGAKMVPFAGWELPVQFPMGVMKEHLHTREAAGLFDVSHMGQILVRHPDGVSAAASDLEGLVPMDLLALKQGRQRYAFFTSEAGGILDDLMVANRGDHLFLVVNAARADHDVEHLRKGLPGCTVEVVSDRALVALQGPRAEAALSALAPEVPQMRFMDSRVVPMSGGEIWVSRSGYTGEDGFEISVPSVEVEGFVRGLLAQEDVAPVGLGARDSLRLEAGLCLYGSDIDEETSPAEADLGWAMQKARRSGGARAGGFPGADRILALLDAGPERLRVGLLPDGRAPMRDGTELFTSEVGGSGIGHVTSGGFGPSLGIPIAMGYVPASLALPGTRIFGEVRGKRLPVTVAALPFRPHTYKRN